MNTKEAGMVFRLVLKKELKVERDSQLTLSSAARGDNLRINRALRVALDSMLSESVCLMGAWVSYASKTLARRPPAGR